MELGVRKWVQVLLYKPDVVGLYVFLWNESEVNSWHVFLGGTRIILYYRGSIFVDLKRKKI